MQQDITFDSSENEALFAATPSDLLLQLMLYAGGLSHIVAACI